MAKEKPEDDPRDGSHPSQPSPTLPLHARLVVGIALEKPQADLFSSDAGDPGANSAFVASVQSLVTPILKELGHEAARQVPPDSGVQVQLHQITTSTLVAVTLLATKATVFNADNNALIATLAERLMTRLDNLMARIAARSPLVRQPGEERDLTLDVVARIKQRGIKQDFCYSTFSAPITSTADIKMLPVESRKRSPWLQPNKPEEVPVKGMIRVSHGGERIRVSRVDGGKAIAARIEHGDPLVYAAHAAGAGGIATYVFEKKVSHCQLAPEIERIEYRLLRIEPDDPSLAVHLNKLVEAASALLSQLKAK